MDEIYDSFYGPDIIPYYHSEDEVWDIHRWNVGVAVACVRHGIKALQTKKTT
eukprot:UN19458